HLIRSWLTPAEDEPDEERDEKTADVCATYQEAPARVATGQRVIRTDEMTGVQALERAAPGLPLRPGKVERREFEYIRHGTLSFMINFDVVSGKVICPSAAEALAEHLGSQVAAAGQFHVHRRSSKQGAGLHRLFQSHHGQTIQVDLSREAAVCLI